MLAVLVVDSLADAPVSGFGDAPGTLRQAIFDANDTLEADEIFFAAVLDGGTIVLTEGELLVNNSLTIDGTQTATGTPLAAGVTIDAAGSDTDPDNPAGDGTRIFSIEDNFQGSPSTSTQATLVGLTLTGADSASNGGAIRSRSSGLLRIQDSTITGNVVTNRIQQSSGSVSGAAIYADGDLELINSTISNNRAYSVEEAYGGAITVGGNATIENSTLDGNILSSESNNARGGAIAALTDGTRVTITGSTLSNNLAEAFDRLAEGGAIAASEVVLENSTVSGNVANGDESTFGGTGRAGGIYAGTLAASFSTIANNRARAYTRLVYLGCADATGGGIAAFAVTLDHTIVADNLAFIVEPAGPSGVATTFGFAQNLLALEGVTDASFSLIGDDEGTGLSPSPAGGPDAQGNLIGDRQSGGIDPLLGDLADNGGPTQTHALRDFSPALDAGDFDFQPPPIFDQRGIGFDRVVNGRVDIGAFEDQEEIVLPELGSLTFNITDAIVDQFDFVTSPRAAIAFANSPPASDTVSFDAAVFAADEAIVLSGGEIEITESLVIDGTSAGGRVTIDAQQGSRIFNVTTPTGDVRLTGVTLTSGRTTGNNVSPDNTFSGGAIRSLTSGTLILEQSTIRDSTTTGDFADGGAIYAAGGVTLIDSTISGNTTSGRDSDGGGVFVRGALTLTQSTISGNRIEGASAAGGGLHATQSVVLTQSTITDNETAYIGGGLWSYIGSVDIRSTIIAGNRAALANPDLRPGTGLLSINFTLIGDSSGTSIDANSGNGNVLDVDSQLFPLADNGGTTQTHASFRSCVRRTDRHRCV